MKVSKNALLHQIAHLNRITGHKLEPYNITNNGLTRNDGTYFLDEYNGFRLSQMTKEGERNPLGLYRHTKSEMFFILDAFITGVESTLALVEEKINNKG
jgi:hypothetical protein